MEFDPAYASTTSSSVSTFNDLLNRSEVGRSVKSKKGTTYYVTKKTPTSVTVEKDDATDVEITRDNFTELFGARRKTKRRSMRKKRTIKRLPKRK